MKRLLDPTIYHDPNLSSHSDYSLQACEQRFKYKKGTLQVISSLQEQMVGQVLLKAHDALYPICSGAHCRSQVLYQVLKNLMQFQEHVLFPPHASRNGYDPYHGRIPSQCSSNLQDDFELFFRCPKQERFGDEQAPNWLAMDGKIHLNCIDIVRSFYDQNYYGPQSHWQGRQGQRRIYIAFARPVHAVLKRLIETNENLEQVVVVAIPLEDEITHPPESLKCVGRSVKAYETFFSKIKPIFYLQKEN